MKNDDMVIRYERCPHCHQRHLRKDQKHYVCESCQVVYAEAQFGQAVLQGLVEQLKQLFDRLDDQQRLHFKQAVVRQAIYYVAEWLPPEAEDDGHRNGIISATRWLQEPTTEKARWAMAGAAGECIDGGVRYFDYPDYFLEPAFVAGTEDAWQAAHLARQVGVKAELYQGHFSQIIPGEIEEQVVAIAQYVALEWQIAVAQALLCAADLSPLN